MDFRLFICSQMERDLLIAEEASMLRRLMAGVIYMPAETVDSHGIGFEGGYEAGLLIFIKEPLQEADKQLLVNILKYCKLGWSDVAIVGPDTLAVVGVEKCVQQLQPKKVIAFGETILYQLPLYVVELYQNIPVLSCISLSDLEKNPPAKKELMKGLGELLLLS